MNLRRVLALAAKEWREVLRDRIYFALTFLLPVILMLVLGYGMTHDVENVPLAVVDYDHSASSREYAQHFTGSRYFAYQGTMRDVREVERAMLDGRLRVAIIIPEQFHQRLTAGRPTEVQVLLDGTFTIAVRTIRGYVGAIHADAAGELATNALARKLGVPPDRARVVVQPLNIETRYLYNEEAKGVWTIAPLLVMFILTWTTPLLLGLGVVREKETGSIYNLYASTVTRAEFLVGKLIPTISMSFLNGMLLWCLAAWYFGAPFRGSFPVFALGTLLFVTASCGIGLVISLVTRTQQAALMLSVILGMLVASEYSGMSTPISELPPVNAAIAHVLPAMYYTAIVEGSFLKGAGLTELGGNLAVLAVQSALILCFGPLLLHKRTRT